jgi:serine protease AprX
MAGIIAGDGAASHGRYPGIAPDARIVSVKVAGRGGATDVSTVLAAMQWVGSYADRYGIRVLNLSWGTPSRQPTAVDPLDYAVERLWHKGIVVVVAGGNDGPDGGTITKPADDPAVLTVGAFDDAGSVASGDDSVPVWSSRGPTADGVAKPDLLAPGRTLAAPRAPGSVVEHDNPRALLGDGYILGSGTSQATAVTAGAAALLLAAEPGLTPDQVKYLLTTTALPIPDVPAVAQGSGEVRIDRALDADPTGAPRQPLTATGDGSLEASRGGRHVETVCPGDSTPTVISGEVDARCQPFDATRWARQAWTADQWAADQWAADQWTADQWMADQWATTSTASPGPRRRSSSASPSPGGTG